MRQVKIKNLSIENFKGLRSFSVAFNDDLTKIVGANGTGKTSIHDAYLWLLLGIDSANRASFSVQPLDESGKTIDRLTTTVTGVFDFDGIQHEIKRCLHQTWTKRRNTKEEVLTGSESEYFIDKVPYKAGEFSKEIANLFCNPEDFKLVSSIRAFGQLDMKSKRGKLIQMAGQMPELINATDYPRLSAYYAKVKNVDAIKRQVKYEMDGLKEKQAEIPIKITENERNMPTGIDFEALRGQLAQKQAEVEAIDAFLQKAADGRASLFSGVNALNEELGKVSAELMEIETSLASQRTKKLNEVGEELVKANTDFRNIEVKVNGLKNDIADLESRIQTLEARKNTLGAQWTSKNKETYPDNIETVCPHCHRPYDEADVTNLRNEAIRTFNSGKAGVLAQISAEGERVVAQIKEHNATLASKKKELDEEKVKLAAARNVAIEAEQKRAGVPSLEQLKVISKEYQNVLAKRDELKKKISSETPVESSDELSRKNQKEQLKREIQSLTMELAKEQNIAKVEARRKELEEENAKLATSIADLDAVMFEIQQYGKAYIELVESQVSSMFKLVTWKMYSKNVSNDGETEICECMVDGVPVSTNVNTAGSINAGIDIINALSKWLGISVPLWIDGKESVTSLIETDAQIITLSVLENSALLVQ